MELERTFDLVVSAGPDLGLRITVESGPQIVGRSREAQLRLTDVSVSRQHLEFKAESDGVNIRIMGNAAPFTLEGKPQKRARLALNQQIIIGNTALTLVSSRISEIPVSRDTCELTSVRSLLGEMAVDARGLGAIFELSEQLDEATDQPQLQAVLTTWASHHVRASEARLSDQLPRAVGARQADDLVEFTAPDSNTRVVSVPLPGSGSEYLAFQIPVEGTITNELRRLLVVAGSITASALMRIRTVEQVQQQNTELRRLALGSARQFMGASPAAEKINRLIERVARADTVVLLLGETGVGKTFVARLIHEASARAAEPLRVINCAAIPDNLVESQLFGHERGAFTGATTAQRGAFEAAGNGTVLLDEIGDLPLPSQAKLLHVLEERQFERLGSNRSQPLRARVLVATNRDLKQMSQDGQFRTDLYYRISVVTLPIEPLRERTQDIPLLAERFLADLASSAGRRVQGFCPEAIIALQQHPWPGNVRELRNVIEHALVLGDEPTIQVSDLPGEFAASVDEPAPSSDPNHLLLPMRLDALEKLAIEAALRATGGNRTRAAALLGINRVTLYKKLRVREPASAAESEGS